ncbi:MAG: subclass B3 metallo-beta-lactamase [Parasphingorhabdus sp.]|nr:subclass B3 metallo-beta-lactamase [Parasphingorhabdus sp.]
MFGKYLTALLSLLLIGVEPSGAAERPAASADIAGACGERDGWSDPAPPAHIHGRSWYVGTCGITVVLVETLSGLVLIDTGPVEAAPQVLANIRALGFDPAGIKLVLMTHEHFDHVGGMAEILRATGAKLLTGEGAAQVMRTGLPAADDPQAGWLAEQPMEPVKISRVLRHRKSVRLGGTRFTIYATPTHSPGSTSWSWRSCQDGQCLTIALADSNSAISTDDYHFSDHMDRVGAARAGLRIMEQMPCDLMLTPHPGQSNLLQRLSGREPLVYPNACATYAAGATDRLDNRLASEAAAQ